MENIFKEWNWRGLLFDATEETEKALGSEPLVVYNGFDPTADSLHVGNLIPMIGLARLQRYGHQPIALAGGGTGMIGDPSGRSTERNLMTAEEIHHNVECIKVQLASLLDFEVKSNPALLVNNADWLSQISMLEFLRDVGKHFSINYMTSKDSVKSRLDRESGGLSYTEFSYMLLQAYDFHYLYKNRGCKMQVGGSDQWGNITAGTTLVRKLDGATVHGAVYPLLTRSDGSKFGKTAEGDSVWLDPERTSPYRFYQFFLNTLDGDVIKMLCFYTFLSQDEMGGYEQAVRDEPHKREAQKRLAVETTRLFHGESGLTKATKASEVFFGGELDGLDAQDVQDIFADVPSATIGRQALSGEGIPLPNLLADAGVAKSRGEARRLIANGGVYINNIKVGDTDQAITMEQSIDGQFLVIRKGKKNYHLVKVE
ncbi:tyrosine--tRNA ligase [Chloroflexi bacterium TSY]|nr:tyrosine--tRNA ligase [Chloroflexi bacterium TSY]